MKKNKLIFISGAGLSAESGLSTFRGNSGLWNNFNIMDICYLPNFFKNYIMVNEFYDQRRLQLEKVEPNEAHKKIAELSKRSDINVINITTNIDNLLERAGVENVLHLHGNLTQIVVNYERQNEKVKDIGYTKAPIDDMSLYPIKPKVVFFGESAPNYNQMYDIFSKLEIDDTIVVIGSSEQVIEFTYLVKYKYRFKGKFIFVNTDKELCNKIKKQYYINDVYEMKATEFFEKYDF